MPLSIKDPEADALARQLSKLTGESLTEAVLNALRERLLREKGRQRDTALKSEIMEIADHCSRLPVLDDRDPDEIIGYDDLGRLR